MTKPIARHLTWMLPVGAAIAFCANTKLEETVLRENHPGPNAPIAQIADMDKLNYAMDRTKEYAREKVEQGRDIYQRVETPINNGAQALYAQNRYNPQDIAAFGGATFLGGLLAFAGGRALYKRGQRRRG